MNIITTLKLTMAGKNHKIEPGCQIGIIDIMTKSNATFEAAMRGFPAISKLARHPEHVALGTHLAIVSDGLTSLTKDEAGRELSFLDMSQALKLGLFGPEPIATWRNEEWSQLISHICAGMNFTTGGWDDLEYCEQTWSTPGMPRSRAPPASRGHLLELKRRSLEPDDDMSFVRSQPKLEATEVMSQTSITYASVTAGGWDEDSEFDKLEYATWLGTLATTVGQIGQDAKSSILPTASIGAAGGSIKKEQAREDGQE
jgi:hypothetical protein